jgi:hypothetical protein
VGESSLNDITVQATVLDSEQTVRLFGADMARRGIIPVLFVMSNKTGNECAIRREHFTTRFGKSRIEPVLPGRAAALLGNSSWSRGAALAGFAVGILAAPSIVAAEKNETAAVEAHREVIFSEARIPPGGKVAGYLFFESPAPFKGSGFLELELCLSGNRNDSITVQLSNPYASDVNK